MFMQEPSVAISSQEAGPDEAPRAFGDDEVARLEKLLSARARETTALSRELERRSNLLREALERLSSAAGSELDLLRRARDAAVQRAIQAEVGRAELAFQLDETRALLQAGGGAISSGPVGELRELYSRIAQLEDADDAQRARLAQAERERDAAEARYAALERDAAAQRERLEQSIARVRAEAAESISENAARAGAQVAAATAEALHGASKAAQMSAAALHGERNGLVARLDESEAALRSCLERNAQAERKLQAAQAKLGDVRAEAAELAVAAQARNTRVSELGLELAREQQELRATRAQLAAAIAAQQAEQRARESDAHVWQQRLQELESESRATPSAGHAHERREFLAGLREPLLQLKAALDEPGSSARAQVEPAEALAESAAGADIMAALEEKLRASETRSAELEAALAARTREAGLHALKGELIDTRADAARLSDDLIRERTRRRRLVVTVRALQAAFESGEAPAPWLEELLAILNEGASVPPFQHG
jgi:hypothetical protein